MSKKSKHKVIVKKGKEESKVIKWEDLINLNKEVRETLNNVIDEFDNLLKDLESSGIDIVNDEKVKYIVEGIRKELEDRVKELNQVENIHSKIIEVDENGKKVKKRAFFTGVIAQDPNDPNHNPKLFEAYLIAMNLYTNIFSKLLSNLNIGKLATLANVKIKEGDINGSTTNESTTDK